MVRCAVVLMEPRMPSRPRTVLFSPCSEADKAYSLANWVLTVTTYANGMLFILAQVLKCLAGMGDKTATTKNSSGRYRSTDSRCWEAPILIATSRAMSDRLSVVLSGCSPAAAAVSAVGCAGRVLPRPVTKSDIKLGPELLSCNLALCVKFTFHFCQKAERFPW